MRILHVVQKPQRRGAETFAFQLGDELRAGGHEVATVYLYPFTGNTALPIGESDRYLHGDESHYLERALGFHPRLLGQLRRAIAEFKPDIVQANGARTVKYASMCRRLDRDGWRLVYRNIGDPREWIRSRRHRLFYKFVMSGVDGVVGVSAATLARVQDFYDLAIPTQNIPRAIRPEALVPARDRDTTRRELQTPPDAPVMIFVGSLAPEKRIDRLLRVLDFARAAVPDIHLWLVGEGPLRSELEQQAVAVGLQDRAHFLGAQNNVASYINGADLLALTSDTEGVPGVILEAGWLERPAVATDVGGVAECLHDGDTGLLVAPDDESDFAGAVARLLNDSEERARMGERAHQWVAERFLMDRIASDYVAFYERVLAV